MIKTDLPLGGGGGGGSPSPSNEIHLQGVFDGGGSAITNNSITYLRGPNYSSTITAWSIIVDTGTITIDVLKIANTDGGTLPVASITAAATPSIAAGNQHYSTILTGWTIANLALDVFAFKVTAISGATKASITIFCSVP